MSNEKNFPTLYSPNSLGKTKYWSVSVTDNGDNSVIYVKYGILEGKEVVVETCISKGKNIGKINETSPFDQAVSQAESKWNKKLQQGYHQDIVIKNDKNKALLPMLALDYAKRGKDISFPCYVQPKLDGIRAVLKGGKIYSRSGLEFPHLSHITDELKDIYLNLDGELYSYNIGFQEIVGIVRKQKVSNEDLCKLKNIVFVVYDTVLDEDYESRFSSIKDVLIKNPKQFTILHTTEVCNSKENVDDFLKKYISDGYEGLILRNFKGKYEIKNRSKNLQKHKVFQDSEFKIVGATEGVGIEKGLVIWICETSNGKTFHVRPKGTHEERKELFNNYKDHTGKNLTVKFFEFTDDGIPRFPVGVCIRDYE